MSNTHRGATRQLRQGLATLILGLTSSLTLGGCGAVIAGAGAAQGNAGAYAFGQGISQLEAAQASKSTVTQNVQVNSPSSSTPIEFSPAEKAMYNDSKFWDYQRAFMIIKPNFLESMDAARTRYSFQMRQGNLENDAPKFYADALEMQRKRSQ